LCPWPGSGPFFCYLRLFAPAFISQLPVEFPLQANGSFRVSFYLKLNDPIPNFPPPPASVDVPPLAGFLLGWYSKILSWSAFFTHRRFPAFNVFSCTIGPRFYANPPPLVFFLRVGHSVSFRSFCVDPVGVAVQKGPTPLFQKVPTDGSTHALLARCLL